MGCDIHAYIDYPMPSKLHDKPHGIANFKWAASFGRIVIPRDYYLFGLLAGVRNKAVEPICAPKGLPEHISILCLYDAILTDVNSVKTNTISYNPDFHTHSWLSLAELKQVQYKQNKCIAAVIGAMEVLGKSSKFIFWFSC